MFAKSFCENGGGNLAQPKTTSTIQAVLEAVNLLGAGGLHWLGGQEAQPRCNPADNDYYCCTSNNPCDIGEGDCDSDDECAGNLVCGTENCAAGNSYMDCCTTTAGTTTATVSEDFLWVGDNSVVDSSNWAQGFPVAG